MTAGDVAIVVDAVVSSPPVRLAKATAVTILAVGFLGLLAAVALVDIARGRDDWWTS